MPQKDGLKKFVRQRKAAMAQMPMAVQWGYFGRGDAIKGLYNELGLPEHGIPERPALRTANRRAREKAIAEIKRQVLTHGAITQQGAQRIGAIYRDELVALLTNAGSDLPENAAWKNLPQPPLHFTGALLKSIGIEIVK